MSFKRTPLMALLFLCVAASLLALPKKERSYTYVSGYFPAQPDNQPIGPAHGGVAVDRAGNYYVSTDTPRGILVFSRDGKYKRCFGPTLIHGLYLQREKDGEYLYCARPTFHEVQKIKIDGTVAWTMGYPAESNLYAKGEEYNPTNIVALNDGTLFVADGYGKCYIHKYDKNRKYLKSFGGMGGMPAEEGKFNRCHGLAVDYRGKKPLLIVCNRESGRVEKWDTDGNLVKILQRGLRMPAAVNVAGDYVAIAELQGRVTVLGKDDSVIAQLGDNPNPSQRANYGLPPEQWTDGIVNSGHGIAIDKEGNIIVSEWSQFGRIHKFAVAQEAEKTN